MVSWDDVSMHVSLQFSKQITSVGVIAPFQLLKHYIQYVCSIFWWNLLMFGMILLLLGTYDNFKTDLLYRSYSPFLTGDCRGRNRMVVGFTTTHATIAYHH